MPSTDSSLTFQFHKDSPGRLPRVVLFAFLFIELSIAVTAVLTGKSFLVFGVAAGLIFLVVSLRSFDSFLAILLLYTCIFPVASWGERYDFFRHYVSYKLILFLLFILVLHWGYTRLRDKNLSIKLYNLDVALLVFMGLAFFGTIRGIRQGFNSDFIFIETITIGMMGIYFLYVNHDIERKDISNLWIFFLVLTIVISIQYILVFMSEFSIFATGLQRITTQQPHLALIALPFIFSTILLSQNRSHKLLAVIGLIPILLMIVISQQRGLWVGTLFSFLVFVTFATLRSKVTLRKVLLLLMLFVTLTGSTVIILQRRTQQQSTEALSKRVETFTELQTDQSLIIRFFEIKKAMDQVGPFSLVGRGIGAQITRVAKLMYSHIVDNAYIYLYWKLGWTGLLTFLIVYFIFFRHCLKIIFHSENRFDQIIALSALSGMSGLCVVALTNVSLVLYRFNLVWALVLASVELIHRNVSKQEPEIASG